MKTGFDLFPPAAERLKKILGSDTDNLFKACLQMNWFIVLIGAFYRFAADICSLLSALSIKWIVKSINSTDENSSFWTSSYLIVLVILTSGLLQGRRTVKKRLRLKSLLQTLIRN